MRVASLLVRDARYACRVLLGARSFTIPALISLTLGVTVNTTMFSVVSALALRPLGATRPGELIRIGENIHGDSSFRALSYPELEYIRDHASTLSDVVGHQPQSVTLLEEGGPRIVWAEIVAGNYFPTLRLVPRLGRAFRTDEDLPTAGDPVAVISDKMWMHLSGGDPGVIGRHITLNSRRFTVIGVAPPGFHGTFPGFDIDLWVPVSTTPMIIPGGDRVDQRSDRFLMVLGRLKPGTSIASARAELQALGAQLAQAFPETNRDRAIVVGSATGVHPAISGIVDAFLALLMAIVGLVLVIACANVANLLLARAGARRREFAVRVAIGAGRGAVIRQMLVESAVLAVTGGACGILTSIWAIRALNAFRPPTGAPIALNLQLDVRVLAFTTIVVALTAITFGMAPALFAARVDVLPALQGTALSSTPRGSRVRRALVVLQVTVSVVLLVGAALMIRSLYNAGWLDPGFSPDHVVVVSFDPQMVGYDRGRTEAFYDELLTRVRALPETERAAYADFVLLGDRGDAVPLTLPGRTEPRNEELTIAYNRVSAGYFETLGVPLLRGRDFDERDRETAPLVAIVNAAMGQRFWPGEDPIGKRLRVRGDTREREIVAIVGDSKYRSLAEATRPFLFLPDRQRFRPTLTLHVRTRAAASAAITEIKRLVKELDPAIPAFDARPLREAMAFSFVPVEIARNVLSAAGAIALLLASVGLYGVVSYTASLRLKEIGIRIALGATARQVLGLVIGGALRLALTGTLIGLALAAAASRVLRALLYALSPTDAVTYAGVAAAMLAVSMTAAYTAARRGVNADPAVVLRRE